VDKANEGGYKFSTLKGEGIHIRTKGRDQLAMIGSAFIPQREELRWLGYFITPDWKWTHHI